MIIYNIIMFLDLVPLQDASGKVAGSVVTTFKLGFLTPANLAPTAP